MFDDPERYEHDGFYEEDTSYEYETDDSDDIGDDEDGAEADEYEKTRRRLAKEQRVIDEIEADAAENPIEDDGDNTGDEQPERKLLKRELRAQALKRLEDSARTLKDYENLVVWYDRTQRDFENVIAWWDKLDANRERRERYHELSRSGDDVPLDYGASVNELFFPDTLNDVLEKQLRKGDFIDAIFYCPYDIHELVTEEYLSEILLELKEDHKELLFLWAVRLFSSTRIAKIREQSDRNIRKVRNTMLKKIQKSCWKLSLRR